MSSGNGRGGGGGRERRGERTRAPLRWQFWRRKALLLVLCAGQSLPQQSLAFGFFTLPRGVNVALSIRSRLPSRGGHKAVRGVAGCRTPARSRGKRTLLRAEFIEDEYARLVRRMARLERIVSGQNAEVEAMRSSMEHMRMIIQIQAQIDSCLVDGGEEGLLSTNLGGGAGGTADEPNPRLVRQAIKLLRMRHRVLQAWEFEGDGGHERQGKDNDGDDDEDAAEALANEFRAMSGLSGLSTPPPLPPLPPDEPIPRNSGGVESAIRRRDGRYEDEEEYAYSMYDPLDSRAAASEERRRGVWGGRGENLGFGSNLSQQQPPKTNQDAADAAGTGVVAALMEGRRRLIVEVDDTQLRYNSPQFCHEAMAEFVELLILPLTTALENLNAEQNRCKIVIQGAHNVAHAKEAMVLDAPDSLQVVSLEDAKVSKKDRVVALVAPENWTGKKGKHLKRVLTEAHDSAIILINPTDADKFLRPADFNTFEHVYNLRPMRVNYLQPLPPPQHPPPSYGGEGGESPVGLEPTGEALLLERLGESLWEEEKALAAAAAAAAAAASSSEEATENESDDAGTGASIAAAAEERVVATSSTGGEKNGDSSLIDGGTAVGAAAAAAEMGVRAAERALARAALGMGGATTSHEPDWGGLDIGYRDREWTEKEDERLSNEAAEAAMAAWGVVERGAARPGDEESRDAGEEGMAWERQRWGEGELGEWRDGDEAAEMSALAVTLRQYPDAWKAFVNLHDGVGFRLCGTWDLEPPQTAVKTVVMDHILRIVMD